MTTPQTTKKLRIEKIKIRLKGRKNRMIVKRNLFINNTIIAIIHSPIKVIIDHERKHFELYLNLEYVGLICIE